MTTEVGLYLVNGQAGNVGTPGAPILHFSLLVNAVTGDVTGHAEQTQAVAPPGNKITIGNSQSSPVKVVLGGYPRQYAPDRLDDLVTQTQVSAIGLIACYRDRHRNVFLETLGQIYAPVAPQHDDRTAKLPGRRADPINYADLVGVWTVADVGEETGHACVEAGVLR